MYMSIMRNVAPDTFDEFTLHKAIINLLKLIVEDESFLLILIYMVRRLSLIRVLNLITFYSNIFILGRKLNIIH